MDTPIPKTQSALYRISEAANKTDDLDELYQSIHAIIGELTPAKNFYIAMYDAPSGTITFPYHVDEYDPNWPPQELGNDLTSYVLRTGKALLASPEVFEELLKAGEVEIYGEESIDWLGVPLIIQKTVIGMIALQSYIPDIRYSQDDLDVLSFVSTQVAHAIERKRAEEALRASEERYRLLFENAPVGSLVATILGEIIDINPKALQILGAPSLQATKEINFLTFPALIESGFSQVFQQCVDQQRVIEGEFPYVSKWGKEIYLKYSLAPIIEEDGAARLIQVMFDDISEIKKSEEEIRQLTHDLETRAEQFALLYEAGLTINSTLDVRQQLEALCQTIMQATHADRTGFYRMDEQKQEIFLEFAVGRGADIELLLNLRAKIGEERGLIGLVAQNRQGLYIEDVTNDPRWIKTDPELKSAVWMPVLRDEHLLGIISVASIKQNAFNLDDLSLVELLANQAAVSIENARLYQASISLTERHRVLHWLSQEIASASFKPERIYEVIHTSVQQVMPAEAFVITLVNEPTGDIELVYSVDKGKRYPYQRLGAGRGLSGHVIESGKPFLVGDLERDQTGFEQLHFGEKPSIRSLIAVPLHLETRKVGMLSTQSYEPDAFSQEDCNMLEMLAAYASIALENSRLFTQMQGTNIELIKAYEATIEGWSRTLEMRDRETRGHSERVTRISLLLAREMGMSDEDIVHFRRGVLLHDIGKMAIPDSILFKPSQLTNDEWIIMRQHPAYAQQLLSGIQFLSPALDIPYCHHEKWDGSGYPRGLKREEIPLGARIFAVVDVWDALMFARPYRPPWIAASVRENIAAQAGVHFDPAVVETFLRLLDSGEITTGE